MLNQVGKGPPSLELKVGFYKRCLVSENYRVGAKGDRQVSGSSDSEEITSSPFAEQGCCRVQASGLKDSREIRCCHEMEEIGAVLSEVLDADKRLLDE